MIFARSDGDFSPCAAIEAYGLLPGDLIRIGVFGVFFGLPCLVPDFEVAAMLLASAFAVGTFPTFEAGRDVGDEQPDSDVTLVR